MSDGKGNLTKIVRKLLFDADFKQKYFMKIKFKYSNRNLAIQIIIAITTSTTVAGWALWTSIPEVWLGIGMIATIVTIINPILKYTDLVGKSSELSVKWVSIEHQAEKLFNKLEVGEPVTMEDYQTIKDEADRVEMEEIDIPLIETIRNESENEVRKERGLPV